MTTKKGTRCSFSPSALWFCSIHWKVIGGMVGGGILAVVCWIALKIADTGWDVFVEDYLLRNRPELVVEINEEPLTEDTVFQIPSAMTNVAIDVNVYNRGKGEAERLAVIFRIDKKATNWAKGDGWKFPKPKKKEGVADLQINLPAIPENTRTPMRELRLECTNFLAFGTIVYGICSKVRTKPHRVHFLYLSTFTNFARLDGEKATAYLNQTIKTNLPLSQFLTVDFPTRQRHIIAEVQANEVGSYDLK